VTLNDTPPVLTVAAAAGEAELDAPAVGLEDPALDADAPGALDVGRPLRGAGGRPEPHEPDPDAAPQELVAIVSGPALIRSRSEMLSTICT
jgi:hypothetical protein